MTLNENEKMKNEVYPLRYAWYSLYDNEIDVPEEKRATYPCPMLISQNTLVPL